MTEGFAERRRHKRFIVNGVSGNVFYPSDLNVINISMGGAAIETTKSLEVNREYPFKIFFNGATLNLKANVVWSILTHSEKVGSGEVIPVYTVGLEFTNVFSDEARLLHKFISKNAIKKSERRLKGIRWVFPTSDSFQMEYHYRYDVKKISLSGMFIEFERPLSTDNIYNMQLLIDENVLNFVGRVANCIEIESEKSIRYGIGIEFKEMSEKDRGVLKSFIDTLETS
ncbi:MAG: PilZ domain-containing protein [Nitrospira sp.]|nr:PilZ domain-containing protein [Nitrospira sp.]